MKLKYIILCTLYFITFSNDFIFAQNQSDIQKLESIWALIDAGDYSEAKTAYEKILPQLETDEEQCYTFVEELVSYASILNNLAQYNTAIEACNKAFSKGCEIGSNVATLSRILNVLGHSYIGIGNYGIAFCMFDFACDLLINHKDTYSFEYDPNNHFCWYEDICNLYTDMMLAAIAVEEYELAESIADKAIAVYSSSSSICKKSCEYLFDRMYLSVIQIYAKMAELGITNESVITVENYYRKILGILDNCSASSTIPVSSTYISYDVVIFLTNHYLKVSRDRAKTHLDEFLGILLRNVDTFYKLGTYKTQNEYIEKKAREYLIVANISKQCGMKEEALGYCMQQVEFFEDNNLKNNAYYQAKADFARFKLELE